MPDDNELLDLPDEMLGVPLDQVVASSYTWLIEYCLLMFESGFEDS